MRAFEARGLGRAQRRAIAKGTSAGTAADVLLTRMPGGAMIWLGLKDRGAAKITYEEARTLADSLHALADEAEADLARVVDDG